MTQRQIITSFRDLTARRVMTVRVGATWCWVIPLAQVPDTRPLQLIGYSAHPVRGSQSPLRGHNH